MGDLGEEVETAGLSVRSELGYLKSASTSRPNKLESSLDRFGCKCERFGRTSSKSMSFTCTVSDSGGWDADPILEVSS
jgi:hypothetical protein